MHMRGNKERVFALGMLRANHGIVILVSINGAIFHIVFRDGRHSTERIAVLVGKDARMDVGGG